MSNQSTTETPTLSSVQAAARRLLATVCNFQGRPSTPDDFRADLAAVQRVMQWLQDPAEGVDLNSVSLPARHSSLLPSCPFTFGQLVMQPIPPDGELPAYGYPLPGQPAYVVGSPKGFSTPEGSIYNQDTERWSGEDTLVIVNTPQGITLVAVDPSEFVVWSESDQPSTLQMAAQSEAVNLEAKILEALAAAVEREGAANVEA